jgi:hypothetical protein
MSASDPFSGLQLIAVLGAWSVFDRLIARVDRPPLFFPVGLLVFGYYLIFLDHVSDEHRALQQQWALAWVLPWSSAVAAYGPVAGLAAAALVTQWPAPARSPGRSVCF